MGSPVSISGLASWDTPNSISAQSLERLGGILYPTMSSLAGTASDTTSTVIAGQGSDMVSSILGASAGAGRFAREAVPWKDIAEWTHRLPKTPTDQWMDVVDGWVRGPNHRWLRQGPTGELKITDYIRHIGLDAITTKGIPLLPEQLHLTLQGWGIPPEALYGWTHVNILDVTVGAMSIGAGGYDIFLSITGHLPWEGMQTLLLTFGVGTLEIAAGVASENPFLVATGAMEYVAGSVSYWKHIHIPTDSVLPHLVHGLLGGIGAGCAVSALRLALTWGTTTPIEKAGIASESIIISSTLGCLAIISPWLSIPLGLSYGLGKFAFRCAHGSNEFWERLPVSSPLTEQLARETIEKYGGQEALRNFDCFRANPIEDAPHPDFLETDPVLLRCLEKMPNWGEAPSGLEHVLAPNPL